MYDNFAAVFQGAPRPVLLVTRALLFNTVKTHTFHSNVYKEITIFYAVYAVS